MAAPALSSHAVASMVVCALVTTPSLLPGEVPAIIHLKSQWRGAYTDASLL